jgi:DNA-binding beta-propeller fold protein YncE
MIPLARLIALVPMVLVAGACTHTRGAPATYHVAKRLNVGGDGGWDYLVADTLSHRLFVSHGTHVVVLNTDGDTTVGDIPNTLGVHGIALAPELGRGFTSNGRDSTVTVFDYRTLATLATIKVPGANPDAIVYEPLTRRVFTFNGRSQDATAIDAATGRIIGNIPLGGKPEAANFDRGRVFVNIEDPEGKVVAFDASSLAKLATWNVTGCEEPSGQAIDRAHSLLFLACSNSVMAVVSYANGSVVATVPIGEGTDGAGFDPARGLAFSTNGGDGTLTVVHEDAPNKFTVVASVPTQRGARTIALDERTHRIYTTSAEFGTAPAPTADQLRPRRPIVPGTFTVLVVQE